MLKLILNSLSTRILAREPLVVAHPRGDKLLLSLPVRNRPVIKLWLSPVQRCAWKQLKQPNSLAQLVEIIARENSNAQLGIIWAITDLERKGFIYICQSEKKTNSLPWPAWKQFR